MASSQAISLKESLATNVAKTLTVKKRAGKYPATDYTTKAVIEGSFIHLYIFHDDTGQEFKYYASDLEESVLADYQAGEKVCVVRIEKVKEDGKRIYFQQWGSPGSAEMTAAPQPKSNTAIIRETRQQDEFEFQKARKDRSIGLRGLVQAHVSTGKPNHEALRLALELDAMIEEQLNKEFPSS